jgi:hypothetical protein
MSTKTITKYLTKDLFSKIFCFLENDRTKFILLLTLLPGIAVGIFLRWQALDSVIINEWVARDLDRALSLFNGEYIPLAGPDLTNGGRLPGPALYFFLAIPLLIEQTYEILFKYNFLLNVTSLIAVFYFLKKYFNYYFASIATAIFSIDLHHISAVHFPTNPSFLFFLLILFTGFFFEFALNKNDKAVPWMVLIFSLGIQFHYQTLTYLIIPILFALIFKIKVSKKSVITSVVILAICFLPYAIYKSNMFIPKNKGFKVYNYSLDAEKLKQLALTLSLQKTIQRLYTIYPFDLNLSVPQDIKTFNRVGFSFALYSFIIYTLIKAYKNGKESCKKNIAVLLLFYIPALIYEYLTPIHLHFWYNHIFALPKSLILASFFILAYKFARQRIIKTGILLGFFIVYVFFTLNAYKVSNKAFNYFDEQLGTINNANSNATGSYKNSKTLLKTVMTELSLSPEEYNKRVYFLDFSPTSVNRAHLAWNGSEQLIQDKRETQNECYFIIDPLSLPKGSINYDENLGKIQTKLKDHIKIAMLALYHSFLKDETIKRQGIQKISFVKQGFPKLFWVYKYIPKVKQSCYTNGHNAFSATIDVRNLLRDATKIRFSPKNSKNAFKEISKEEKYNSESELIYFKGNYVVLNAVNETPFRIIVTVEKNNDHYSILTVVYSFYYFSSGNLNFSYMDILLTPKNNVNKTNEVFSDRLKSGIKVNVLTKNTLVTSNGLNTSDGNGMRNYNEIWSRESQFNSKHKLIKNNFYLDLIWTVYSINNKQNNTLLLKKPDES